MPFPAFFSLYPKLLCHSSLHPLQFCYGLVKNKGFLITGTLTPSFGSVKLYLHNQETEPSKAQHIPEQVRPEGKLQP